MHNIMLPRGSKHFGNFAQNHLINGLTQMTRDQN